MGRSSLPPGFRFHPTDVELVLYYLRRKVMGKALRFEVITELDLYKFAPWDLPEKSCLKSSDLEWYFFCPRDRKYASGERMNRATEIGYWKTTGRDRDVSHNLRNVGMKKTLVFHLGRAPRGDRTNWVMHEYRLQDKDLVQTGILQDAYVLCKIFEKGGAGPRNGEQHVAPFQEEDWEDEDDLVTNTTFGSIPFARPSSPSLLPSTDQNVSMELVGGSTFCSSSKATICQTVLSNITEDNLPLQQEDDIVKLMELFGDEDCGDDKNEMPDSYNPESTVETPRPLDGGDIYNGLEDLNNSTCQMTFDKILLPNSLGDAFVLDQMLAGDNISFLELDDLEHPMNYPVGAYGSDCIQSDLCNNFQIYDTLGGSCDTSIPLPTCEEDNSVRETAMLGYEGTMENPVTPFGGKAQDTETTYGSQDLARGEEKRTSSYSKFQYLLDSIPARPALAAEYRMGFSEGSKGSVSATTSSTALITSSSSSSFYGGSSIHVKAEVTVRCGCTEDALSEKMGEYKYNKKVAAPNSGYVFVFILGLLTALFWVFLLAIGAKIGKYVWDLISYY